MSDDYSIYFLRELPVLSPVFEFLFGEVEELEKEADIYSDIYQYADDTLVLYCNSNLLMLEMKLQDDIDSIVHWLVSNKLYVDQCVQD